MFLEGGDEGVDLGVYYGVEFRVLVLGLRLKV